MTDRLLGIFWHQALKFGLGVLVLEMCLPGSREDRGELGPRVGGSHIDNPHGFKPRLRRLDAEQLGLFATFHTAPELALGRDKKVLIERIGVSEIFFKAKRIRALEMNFDSSFVA